MPYDVTTTIEKDGVIEDKTLTGITRHSATNLYLLFVRNDERKKIIVTKVKRQRRKRNTT